MKICIAGKNNIATDILDYIIKNKLRYNVDDILVVVNKSDNGENNWQKSLKKFAIEKRIEIVALEELYEEEDLLFLSLEFDRIIVPSKFRSSKLFNIHFSLLPKYKGMYTSIMPILFNEKYSGVTFHKIDSGIDTGDIIFQEKIYLEKNETARSLYFKYIEVGTRIVKENFENILLEKFKLIKQSSVESSYYSKKSIDFTNVNIDLNDTAISIDRKIRAFNFREYQLPTVFGSEIISAKITADRSIGKAGKILFETESSYLITTIDYNIILYKDKSEELIRVCTDGDLEEVRKIINVKEHLNVQNYRGWTPLIVSTYNNNIEIVKLLIESGSDVSIKNYNGTNLQMYAKDSYKIYGDRTLYDLFKNGYNLMYLPDYKDKNVIDYIKEEGLNELI